MRTAVAQAAYTVRYRRNLLQKEHVFNRMELDELRAVNGVLRECTSNVEAQDPQKLQKKIRAYLVAHPKSDGEQLRFVRRLEHTRNQFLLAPEALCSDPSSTLSHLAQLCRTRHSVFPMEFLRAFFTDISSVMHSVEITLSAVANEYSRT